jgi:hypothetical protein
MNCIILCLYSRFVIRLITDCFMTTRYLAAFIAALFSIPALSQLAYTDSIEPASLAATTFFLQALQNEKEIYNGPEHIEYLPNIEGIAYFGSKDWQTGAVQYDGITYQDVAIQYDLVKDRVVVKRPDNFAIELRSDKVDWFSLAQHVFVYIPENNTSGLKAGFYDELAAGAITVLVKRRKLFQDRIEDTRARRLFVDEITYYAVKNNQAHVIRNLHSLLALTGKKSGEIQQQLRRAGIKFRDIREAALAAAAQYYNQTQH